MHLVGRRAKTVRVDGGEVRFAAAKTDLDRELVQEPSDIAAMAAEAGFTTAEQWIDGDAGFALTLRTVR